MRVGLHACVTSVRDDVGLRRAQHRGRMRSLGESEEHGMDQDQDERCEKETDEVQSGESTTQRAHRTASRDPDSNIVLGMSSAGLPRSVNRPDSVPSATKYTRQVRTVSFFSDGKSGSRSRKRSRLVANSFHL